MKEFSRLAARHAVAMGLIAAVGLSVASPAQAQSAHSGHSRKAHAGHHGAPALPDVVTLSITQGNDPATGKPYPPMQPPAGLASADELAAEIDRARLQEEQDPAGQWVNGAALASLPLAGALALSSLAGAIRRRRAAKGEQAPSAEEASGAPLLGHLQLGAQNAPPSAPAVAFGAVGRPRKSQV